MSPESKAARNVHLKNPADLVGRLELAGPESVLLVDSPGELSTLVAGARSGGKTTRETSGDAIRSVKEKFDAIVVWREDRSGSRSIFERAVDRLEPGGALWIVTAMKKVRGPLTPAVHRLELSDLVKAFGKEGLAYDREVRVTAWNVAYRFVKREPRLAASYPEERGDAFSLSFRGAKRRGIP